VQIARIIPQLRTRNLASTIAFYTTRLGFTLEFEYDDFYAGVRADGNMVHLKRIEETDPSIEFVDEGGHFHLYLETDDIEGTAERLKRAGVPLERDVHERAWATRELVIRDDQGHTLYFGQPI
jgi:catechol 2,3-dioxygenase-like lactoylglutathione lyase family enzyme